MFLQSAIAEYESKGVDAVIQVPFTFFEELHKEHSRILESLDKKINEAENLAKEIFSQNSSASPASHQEDKPLKAKIFSICQIIYDQ